MLKVDVWGDNLFDLWKKVNDTLFFHTGEYPFERTGVSIHTFNNHLHSSSASIGNKHFHIHSLGYTKTKWSMLIRLYFDQEEFALLVNRLIHYRSTTRGKKYVPDIGCKFKSRQNIGGACLMGLTVRYTNKFGWECEVFSRASEITARWGVDVIFLNIFIKTLGNILRKERPDLEWFKAKDVTVHWNAASMFQSMTSAPLYLALTGQQDYLVYTEESELTQWQKKIKIHFDRAYHTKNPLYQKYKTQARSTRAYHQVLGWRDVEKPVYNKELFLPVGSVEIDSDFFTRKGFR